MCPIDDNINLTSFLPSSAYPNTQAASWRGEGFIDEWKIKWMNEWMKKIIDEWMND